MTVVRLNVAPQVPLHRCTSARSNRTSTWLCPPPSNTNSLTSGLPASILYFNYAWDSETVGQIVHEIMLRPSSFMHHAVTL